ncbi:MAG: biopolymer transporter ExbD, partial [Parvibaculum sp.]
MFEEPIRKRGMASLTPLIDVVFLLLIFFMLTTSFLQEQSLSVVTPAPSADELPKDARVVEIWLNGDGSIAIDGEPVERAALSEGLKAAIG